MNLYSDRTATSFSLTATGEDDYVVRALNWNLKQLISFFPSSAELARARERTTKSYRSSYINDFSALIGVASAKNLVDPFEALIQLP